MLNPNFSYIDESTENQKIFDYPPTRHPKLNFFNYYPNEKEPEGWHPILKYMTETTLKRFSTMHCVEWKGKLLLQYKVQLTNTPKFRRNVCQLSQKLWTFFVNKTFRSVSNRLFEIVV